MTKHPTHPSTGQFIPKPAAAKFHSRLITLDPELAARLDRWQADNPKQVSPMIAKLVDIFLTQEGY